MAAPKTKYTFTKPARDSDQLRAELVALAFPGFVAVNTGEGTVDVLFDAPLSDANRVRLVNAVAAHVPSPTAEADRAAARPREAVWRSARVPFGPLASRAVVSVPVTWAVPFRTGGYTVTVGVTANTAVVSRVVSQTPAGCVVEVRNITGAITGLAAASASGTVHALAVHD